MNFLSTSRKSEDCMAITTVHVVLGKDGNIGKTFLTSILLYQCLRRSGATVEGIDLDTENKSFSSFREDPRTGEIRDESFNASYFEILEKKKVSPILMNHLISYLRENRNSGGHIILDNGANNYTTFVNYLVNNRLLEVLMQDGIRVIVHTIIIGGANYEKVAIGAAQIAEAFSCSRGYTLVLWKNNHFGEIDNSVGFKKTFATSEFYRNYSSNFTYVVEMPGPDDYDQLVIQECLNEHIAFDRILKEQNRDFAFINTVQNFYDSAYAYVSGLPFFNTPNDK